MDNLTSPKILDVGCGEGELPEKIAKTGYLVTALDAREIKKYIGKGNPKFVKADILKFSSNEKFDYITAISTIEHIGLAGRYGQTKVFDGDIKAMEKIKSLLKKNGKFILTIPVGKDTVVGNLHRVYGKERLPLLFSGWKVEKESFWIKEDGEWIEVNKERALEEEPTENPPYYALGLFVLKNKND